MSNLVNTYNFTLSQLTEFFSKKDPCILKKGETFIGYGETSGKLGIVLDGLLYSSYISEGGKEWISNFFYPPNHAIVTSHESFLRGKQSIEEIRAYEDSQIIYVLKSEFDKLVEQNPQLEHMVRVMAEESYVQTLKRVYSFQSQTAIQRVRRFVTEHSDLITKVQRQHIASYLGIHRNIFTRILSKI